MLVLAEHLAANRHPCATCARSFALFMCRVSCLVRYIYICIIVTSLLPPPYLFLLTKHQLHTNFTFLSVVRF